MRAGAQRSEARAALNELTFKDANEKLARRRDELGLDHEKTPFICECESETCRELVSLSAHEYSTVRASASRFFLVTGHPTAGTVVDQRDGWVVVEKDEV
jgi:hypothetical protein